VDENVFALRVDCCITETKRELEGAGLLSSDHTRKESQSDKNSMSGGLRILYRIYGL
jgi:hypothetical protein